MANNDYTWEVMDALDEFFLDSNSPAIADDTLNTPSCMPSRMHCTLPLWNAFPFSPPLNCFPLVKCPSPYRVSPLMSCLISLPLVWHAWSPPPSYDSLDLPPPWNQLLTQMAPSFKSHPHNPMGLPLESAMESDGPPPWNELLTLMFLLP